MTFPPGSIVVNFIEKLVSAPARRQRARLTVRTVDNPLRRKYGASGKTAHAMEMCVRSNAGWHCWLPLNRRKLASVSELAKDTRLP